MKIVSSCAVLVAACVWFSGCGTAAVSGKAEVEIDVPPSGGGAPPPVVVHRPRYRILELMRDPGSDFAYSFEILPLEEIKLNVLSAIKREFRAEILRDYAQSFPVRNSGSVYVDFPKLKKCDDGTVKGRAQVFLATPVAFLDYDAQSRRGKITVQFNSAVGTEEAREWARRNIETLANDKNIVLISGKRPPPGQYTSLGETWRKDTLEIEFKVN